MPSFMVSPSWYCWNNSKSGIKLYSLCKLLWVTLCEDGIWNASYVLVHFVKGAIPRFNVEYKPNAFLSFETYTPHPPLKSSLWNVDILIKIIFSTYSYFTIHKAGDVATSFGSSIYTETWSKELAWLSAPVLTTWQLINLPSNRLKTI